MRAKWELPLIIAAAIWLGACSPADKPVQNGQRASTAATNVQVLEDALTIPGLERKRTIRIYLPPSYGQGEQAYPVLYMHDAQNLFDDATSYAGEWGIDETLNQLATTNGLELIVVGIDNGGEKRMQELSPWRHPDFGEPEGGQYVDFIVHNLKPYIDANYRTLADSGNTAIAGSSMGGLISHYAIHKYPGIFGKAGIFSPSYWFSEDVFSFTKNNPLPNGHKLYLVVGAQEGHGMVPTLETMVQQLHKQGHQPLLSKVDGEGGHNEASWRRQFPEAVKWLFQE